MIVPSYSKRTNDIYNPDILTLYAQHIPLTMKIRKVSGKR